MRLAVLAHSHVEDHCVCVKLWCCITIDRPCRIVFKRRRKKLTCILRRMNIADARLCVSLQFSKRDTHALTMCIPHANITAHKRGKRNGLRRGKGCIPSGPVLDARYLLAVFVLVGPRGLMFDELRSVLRMLAIAQICEVFCMNSTMKIPIFGSRMRTVMLSALSAAVSNGKINYNAGGVIRGQASN